MRSPTRPSGMGELVVCGGDRRGTHLPLRHPVTVMGADDGCDVRLETAGVNPIHCLITITATGPIVRSWVPGATLVNGTRRTEAALKNGDEIGIGPWLFRLMWTPTPEPSPPDRAIPLDEAALAARYSQIVQHSRQLAESRAELREQRRIQLDAIATLRSRIEEQLAEATSLQREAVAGKAQLKTLASRFMRRMKRKWLATRQELNAERAELDRQRQTLMSAAHNLQLAWSKVHTREAAQRDCVRDAWVAIETSQRRASEEWSETNAYFQEQNALLNQRTIRISERESSVNQRSAQASQEIKRLLQEATGLEARALHARRAVEESERKRVINLHDKATPSVAAFSGQVPLDRARESTDWTGLSSHGEDEPNAQPSLRPNVDGHAEDVADRELFLREEFAQLLVVRERWRQLECGAVAELEQLAEHISTREQQLLVRENNLIERDGCRRRDAYDLWTLQLKYEAWQTKLLTAEARLADYRDRAVAELTRRSRQIMHREQELEALFERWTHTRKEERERVRAGLDFWQCDRDRFSEAVKQYELQSQNSLADLAQYAATALAAEQRIPDSTPRRIRILKKRWDRVFDRKLREIATQRSILADESARIERHYSELMALQTQVLAREAAVMTKASFGELESIGERHPFDFSGSTLEQSPAAQAELTLLRAEVERLAVVLIDADRPPPPLPQAASHDPGETFLPFVPPSQAA